MSRQAPCIGKHNNGASFVHFCVILVWIGDIVLQLLL